jgi:hypothetical protein
LPPAAREQHILSVRCDSGKIKVLCFDESDTERESAFLADHPLGENGKMIRYWTHIQTADVDPGLKAARD